MFIKKVNYLYKFLIIFFLILPINISRAEFFKDISNIITINESRLSYGVSVTDINSDGNNEFIVKVPNEGSFSHKEGDQLNLSWDSEDVRALDI